jgi:amidohydrolase
MIKKAIEMQTLLSKWRRDFHKHPELGFNEIRTSKIVAEMMEKFGYRVRRGVGRTGVVAEIGNGKPIFAIRADMDALPLQETNQVSYVSKNPGVMHACGHDSHMAMALGAARLLAREKFQGTVRFLFQPSEEVADNEGLSGAPRMIADGAMDGVDMVIAAHVEATTPAGSIRIKAGPASGGVDSWYGQIIGKGGHGAHPHETIDPFYITAHVIIGLNAIVSRRLDPIDAAVISIGSINGGFTENVIPEKVKITGTLRYAEKRVQQQIHAEISRVFNLARTLGGDYDLKIQTGTPPMLNSPEVAAMISEVGVDLLGKDKVLPWIEELGAEDFGSFMELAPGAMFALGTANAHIQRHLHSPDYDMDESAMPVGTAIFTEMALRYFNRGK